MKLHRDVPDAWETLARSEPLFAVVSDPRYRTDQLTPHTEAQFWRSGDTHVENVVTLVERHFGSRLEPERALDFGCGVGRLLIPIARRAGAALGVDASPAMLSLSRSACDRAGLSNVSLAATIPEDGSFDFVNTLLVLQHMAPRAGFRTLDQMFRSLTVGGFLAVHVLFDRPGNDRAHRLVRWLTAKVPPVRTIRNALRGEAIGTPYMAMNTYDMHQVIARLARNGIRDVHILLTSDAGFESALIIGRKGPLESPSLTSPQPT